MTERFPGYDVQAKRHSPSWNEQTRRVIDQRLAIPRDPQFLTRAEFATLQAIADRLVPQPRDRAAVPVAALVDHRLHVDQGDGYRHAGMPRAREAWRQGLQALDAEAIAAHGAAFHALPGAEQDTLLQRMQDGDMHRPEWGTIPPKTFFTQRLRDVVMAYYSHPTAWNEMGFGGPASPRGYVRMGYDMRDPWEAAEVQDGDIEAARRKNRHVG